MLNNTCNMALYQKSHSRDEKEVKENTYLKIKAILHKPLLELYSHWWQFTLIQLSEANELRCVCTSKGRKTVELTSF